MEKDIIQKNKKLAALSYFWLTCPIPLIFSKDEFVKFHAKQGFTLSLIQIIVIFIFVIPVIGWILSIIVIFITILAIKSALSGGMWRIPYVFELSERIKIN